jgi:hypothetical protein
MGRKIKVDQSKISECMFIEINNGRAFVKTLGNATLIMTKSYKHTPNKRRSFASLR